MSFFGNHDVNDISDNPNELPPNTYKFRVISAKFAPTQGGDKHGITFKYQIVEGPYATFFPLTDWVRVPVNDVPKDEEERLLSYLKMRLLAFGFSLDEIQEFGPGQVNDTVNRMFFGTTGLRKDKNGQTNIRVNKFDPVSDDTDVMDDI